MNEVTPKERAKRNECGRVMEMIFRRQESDGYINPANIDRGGRIRRYGVGRGRTLAKRFVEA